MPIIHHHIASLRDTLKHYRSQQRIALVPTMGNLHDGHLALVTLAKQHADIVVVSIFVNPTQFGVGEDFNSYPRMLEADVAKLTTVGTDYVFAPTSDEMYPILPLPTSIHAGAITTQLCGQTRPTHFDGVGIVVSKLFNIVQPNVAIFGQKDYQQLAIIKQLVRDLSYPIDIITAPIVRATDGLALSSRNQYLSPEERNIAPLLQQELQRLAQQFTASQHTQKGFEALIVEASKRITAAGFIVDYLEVKTAELEALNSKSAKPTTGSQDLIIVVAAWLGRARLLDNLLVTIY
ncbi:pantoate--beta-alanine ligase [Psychrobacter urativorans]|uniref:pantoate--beta-alanine ligase n=1 Tax=Psychrobacter urativorans TaxID=45610 RepID=UPI00191A5DA8|nr:pantoate--beta-alanine ligase [Psychrobacter urativorans]